MPRFLCCVALAVCAALPARAQTADTTSANARFRLAETYLRGGQPDRAALVLEDLYAENASLLVYQKLSEAYQALKRYDDALALLDRRRAGADDPALLTERAGLLYLKGDENAAFAQWQAVIDARPDDPGVYQQVYTAMLEYRLFERAIGVLEGARARLKNPDLFTYDLAYLYSLDGRHDSAAELYADLVARDPGRLAFVRSRLARFTETGEATDATIAVAERRARREPLNRAFREWLVWLYVEKGDYAAALDAVRAIDRMGREEGGVLYGFARSAADAGAFAPALEAYTEILTRYPDAPAAAEALYGLGRLHESWGAGERRPDRADASAHTVQALDAYRRFARQYPNHPAVPDVQRRTGRLELDVFHDAAAAEPLLREVATRYAQTEAGEEAAYDLGRAALMRGDLDAALIAFSALEEKLRVGDLAERARYERALIDVYRGDFDAAQTLVDILNDNTSTDTANDAIELTVLLIENRGPDSLSTPLRHYARARLLLRQHHAAAALDTLDALLAAFPGHNIADEATMLRAQALREAGRVDEAAAALAAFAGQFPQSYLADRSLLELADIEEYDRRDPAAALATLTRLLTDYPGSLFTADVRQRVRRLRGDGAAL